MFILRSWEKASNSEHLILLHPLGYHEMLRLNMDARLMLTDSGGLCRKNAACWVPPASPSAGTPNAR